MPKKKHSGQRKLGTTEWRPVGPRRDESRFRNSERHARATPLKAPDHGGRGVRWRSAARKVVLWHRDEPRRLGPNAGQPWGACTIITTDGGAWSAFVLDGAVAPHWSNEWAFAVRTRTGWWYWPDRMARATVDPHPHPWAGPDVRAWEKAYRTLRPSAPPIPLVEQASLPVA